MPTHSTLVGHVAGLWRYPVKSMAAEPLESVEVSWHGLTGDRRWAFVRHGVEESGFPWLTLRQRGNMSHYRPRFSDPEQPDISPTTVQTPSGDVLDVTDPTLAAELFAGGARVIRQNRGVFDAFPVSLITTQTVARLGEQVGDDLDVLRFRPNLVVDAASGEPFTEDEWVGLTLRIGGLRMRVDKRDGRCVVITIDPLTGLRAPEVLKTVVQERQGCLGVYGSTVEEGRVTLGDAVVLDPPRSAG